MSFQREYTQLCRRIMRTSRSIVAGGLSKEEDELKTLLDGYLPLGGTCDYPYMFLLCYGGIDPTMPSHVERLAAGINLLQASTFVVDDILDKAAARYGRATIWSKHGNATAVNCGQLMQALAMEAIIDAVQLHFTPQMGFVVERVNRIIKDVYRGQNLDIVMARKRTASVREYEQMISLTTGNFFRHIAQIGAKLAQTTSIEARALDRFAYYYGLALQATDDIVDIEGNPAETGKDFALDIENSRQRLPAIYARKCAKKQDRNTLDEFFSRRQNCESNVATIVKIIRRSGALVKSMALARQYLDTSAKALLSLPAGPNRRRCEFLVKSLFKTQSLK